MRLIKLVLHNFRQYKHQEILFPQSGLMGILGKNGAGKSTLFNAIGWCLYGKLKDVNKELIPNVTASPKDSCYVELFFSFQGTHYHARRDLRKTNDCFLKTADGTPYAIGTSNLTSFVEENLFKMDYSDFCACYYAEQDDFDNLIKLTSAKRVETITKLLRIEKIDAAAKKARKDAQQLKTEAAEARKYASGSEDLAEQQNGLQADLAARKQALAENALTLDSLLATQKRQTAARLEAQQQFEAYQDLQLRLRHAQMDIDTLTHRSLQSLRQEQERIAVDMRRRDTLEPYRTSYPALQKQVEATAEARAQFADKQRLAAECSHMQQELARYEAEQASLEAALRPLTEAASSLAEAERTLSVLQEEEGALREKHQEAALHIQLKGEAFAELKAMKQRFDQMGEAAPCPTCERPLGDHYAEKMTRIKADAYALAEAIQTLQSANQEREEAIRLLRRRMQETLAAIQTLRAQQSKQEQTAARLSFLQAELANRQEKHLALSRRLAELSHVSFDEALHARLLAETEHARQCYHDLLSLDASAAKWPHLEAQLAEVTALIDNRQQEAAALRTALQALNFQEDIYRSLEAQLDDTARVLQETKNEQTRLTYDIQHLEQRQALLAEQQAKHQQMLAAITEKEHRLALLTKLDESYKQYKSEILSKLAPTLSAIMRDDMAAMTDGKYNWVELDDQYNIYLYRQNQKFPLSFFSGGEKKLAALCLRMAISALLIGQTGLAAFEMLAMDEVFGAMDTQRQDHVMDQLRALNHKFPQILLVTHSDSIKDLFDHVLEISQDAKGNSVFQYAFEWDEGEVRALLAQFDSSDAA